MRLTVLLAIWCDCPLRAMRGQSVTCFGRQGQQRTELFPGGRSR